MLTNDIVSFEQLGPVLLVRITWLQNDIFFFNISSYAQHDKMDLGIHIVFFLFFHENICCGTH